MRYVIDASVAVKWYVPESHSVEAERLLDPQYELCAPELIVPEFGNIIWKKMRRKELRESEGQQIIREFQRAGVNTFEQMSLLTAAFTGAQRSGLTVYDWTYMALAVALDCEFVTADEQFYDGLKSTRLKKHLLWVGDVS
jgi:predicted nucleic acid-binding protein